jgi:beta-galactosidase GanA
MRHLREVDGDYHTVLMVQVENEVGFLPFAREGGNGPDLAADERAMATAYARYVEAVAAAGKREYPLPMYVNGAQARYGVKPGDYPSGGPLAHLAEIWRREAPSLDFIAPDIYFPNFIEIAQSYVESGNPLFIPEADRASNPRIAANALNVIGQLDAIGFSPFAIEDADEAAAKRIGGLYAMLESIAPDVLRAQAEGRIEGFGDPVSIADTFDPVPVVTELGPAVVTATTVDPWTPRDAQDPSTHGALLIWFGGNHYLVAGQGVTFTFAPADGQGRLGFEWVEEGQYVDGQWEPGRRLNGDQTHQGRHVRLPPGEFGVQLIQLYRY